jgi:hypothetical protein
MGRIKHFLKGLILGNLLAAVDVIGAFYTVQLTGGFGDWTLWQFFGLVGIIEIATGIAFISGPNIWRFPVMEANTSDRTSIHFAASAVLIPHWAAGAKILAGIAMLVPAAIQAGIGSATIGIPLLILSLVVAILGFSAIVARLGVAKPEWDVFYLSARRPGSKTYEVPGMSIGGSIIQFVLSIGAVPAIKLLHPDALYHPHIGPSPELLWGSFAVAVLLLLATWVVWRGRISWQAPREQQHEQERAAQESF